MQLTEAFNMGMRNTGEGYRAAIYCRLSRDDNNGNTESMSIQSQRDMLVAYAEEKGFEVAEIYCDDGFSGTTFQRPNFQRMIQDIKMGKINMVLTKDLSRLGRNYVMTGEYTDFIFPQYGVRYIALNDSYDSVLENNDIAPFKHILNEMFAADISKKVRSSRKIASKQGKFMGSKPSYGYKRSEDDKHKLIIDEPAAKIVRRIFELYKNHESGRHIADILNNESVASPLDHNYQSVQQVNPYTDTAKSWSSATVLALLKKEVYIGQMVQGKNRVKSFKTKERQKVARDLWIVVDNTHDAIIDKATWDAVQRLLETNKNSKPRKVAGDKISLFSNILYCRDCGSRMTLTTRKRPNKVSNDYRCSRYLQHGAENCSPHNLSLESLSTVVLEDIQKKARLAIMDEDAFIRKLHQVSLAEKNAEQAQFRKREDQIKRRSVEIDGLIQKTFEKNIAGILPDSMMKNLLANYEQEKIKLEDDLSALWKDMARSESQTADISKEIERLKRHVMIRELDRDIVTKLVQSIYVSEPAVVDGEKTCDIEIRYKFQNVMSVKKETSSANEISDETCEAVSV